MVEPGFVSKPFGSRNGVLGHYTKQCLSLHQTCLKGSKMGAQWKEQASLPGGAGEGLRGGDELARGTRWRTHSRLRSQHMHGG